MTSVPARLAFLSSLLLLVLAGLVISSQFSKENGSKAKSLQLAAEHGQVLSNNSSPTYYYKFYLKDASKATQTLGAQVLTNNTETDSSVIAGASIYVLNPTSFNCGDSGSAYTFNEISSGFYKLICKQPGAMQIQISKAGYQTKTVSLPHYTNKIPTITLSVYVPPPPPPPETIKDISLPKTFLYKGSKTTDLKKIADASKVKGLVLDTATSTIEFKDTVNLSSTDTKNKFKSLDKYVRMAKPAIVGLDSKQLKDLNKKAAITMKGLPWINQPKVLVDGKEDSSVVSNIKYSDGTLTFDTTHFSTFKAAPTINVTEPVDGFEVNKNQIELRGEVSDRTASVSAKLNGQDLRDIKTATDSAELSTTLNLVEGFNTIVISAVSDNGTSDKLTINGYYVKKTFSAYIYTVVGVLAIVAIMVMVYSYLKIRKNKARAASSTQKTTQP